MDDIDDILFRLLSGAWLKRAAQRFTALRLVGKLLCGQVKKGMTPEDTTETLDAAPDATYGTFMMMMHHTWMGMLWRRLHAESEARRGRP